MPTQQDRQDLEMITTGADGAAAHLVLAHGAGAPMQSPFMEAVATLMSARKVAVTRFHFAYMAKFVADGKRRPPPRVESLTETVRDVVLRMHSHLEKSQSLFVGGKSMGGRVASLIADDLYQQELCRGIVCLGYPFHPSGKPETLRTAHLEAIKTPMLIIQGTRDALGNHDEVGGYHLSPSITLSWIADGDHDLKPRKKSGRTQAQNLEQAADAAAHWILAWT